MTTIKDTLSKGEQDDAEQAIEDDEKRKEREEREERRSNTKYGGKIDGEINK